MTMLSTGNEKSKKVKNVIESIYNLGLLNLRLKEYNEAEKYFKEGLRSDDSRCEYMLAWLYYKIA